MYLQHCPICDKPISNHMDEPNSIWNCSHSEDEYRLALRKMHDTIIDMSLEMAGEDA